MLCIGTGKTVNDPNRMRFGGPQWYVRTPEEMANIFSHIPDAVTRTVEVAEMCNLKLPLARTSCPSTPSRAKRATSRLTSISRRSSARVTRSGARRSGTGCSPKATLKHSLSEYQQRISTEIATIKQMGFPSYFLIVWDFIKFAKDRRIPVGPGRGSAAGSLDRLLSGDHRR